MSADRMLLFLRTPSHKAWQPPESSSITMESSKRRRVFDPDDEARSEEEELVQKIAGMILDGRDAMETKSEDEAERAFINSATFINTLSAHGTMPKNRGTTLEKRMGQLVASASELDDTFGLARCIVGTNMGDTAMAIIGAYRFGMQRQVSQAASREEAQAQPYTSPGAIAGQSQLALLRFTKKRVEKRKSNELNEGPTGLEPEASQPKDNGNVAKKRSARNNNANNTSHPQSATSVDATAPNTSKSCSAAYTPPLPRALIKTKTYLKGKWMVTINEFSDGRIEEHSVDSHGDTITNVIHPRCRGV